MEWLNIVAKDHKEWVKVVESFGEDFFAEDIVQEAYLRIYKYCQPENIIKNGQVNKGFMYFTLRNLYLLHLRSNSRLEKVPLEQVQVKDEPSEMEKEEAYYK